MIPVPPHLEHLVPYRGKCAFCGYDDARHRLFDAIASCYRAGDTIELLADDYGLDVEVVRWIVTEYEYVGEPEDVSRWESLIQHFTNGFTTILNRLGLR